MAERGIRVDHVTVYRWVQRFTAEFIEAARPCRRLPGDRWFVDETLRRGHYEIATDEPGYARVPLAFERLAQAA